MTQESLHALTDPALVPLFRRPTRTGVLSAWYGHVPFAHWIVGAARPRSIVELGSHWGVSYSAFCEAVLQEQLDARCFAIDTWQGDDHAGFYGDEVFADFQRFHVKRYGGFSEMIRSTFDAALPYLPDGSIDLLHIDGRHGYDDVRHDFRSWETKLSDRAVVLLHDTNVRENEFGVWRMFGELRETHECFEFLHAHGLGVVAYGEQAPEAVRALCRLRDPTDVATVRERFALLGERWVADFALLEEKSLRQRVQDDLEQTRKWGGEAQAEVNRLFPLYRDLLDANRMARGNLAIARHELAARERELERQSQALGAVQVELDRARDELERARGEAGGVRAALAGARLEISALETQRRVLLGSRTWRAASALRRAASFGRAAPILVPETMRAPSEPEIQPAAPVRAEAMDVPVQKRRALFISGEPETPGHVYRVERMVQAALCLGWEAEWMDAAPVGPAELAGRDLVVLWRVRWSEHIQGIVEVSHENGATVIFDVDDLMFRPELAVTDIIDAIRSLRFSELETQAFFRSIQQAMLQADIVTCTTEELAFHIRRLGRPAMVLPNGFDDETVRAARHARRNWRDCADGLLRIGYAGGTRTHQKDFLQAVPAVARVLREHADARLTLFRDPRGGEGLVLIEEYPELAGLEAQIEWRDMVPLAGLPAEIARFDINLAPLEPDNPFCEAKSELKYFEAGLAGVPTVASGSGPFRRAITEGVTGFVVTNDGEWYAVLSRLAQDAALRARIGQNALHDALARFGPEMRLRALRSVLEQAAGGPVAAAGFARDLLIAEQPRRAPPHVPASEILLCEDRRGDAAVTVIVPVYNYADYVPEALQSVAAQRLEKIDLVVVDDRSTDDSVQVVQDWIGANRKRFNRIVLLRQGENSGLGFARNAGFAAAETPFVLPLDADNRLRENCCEQLLAALAPSRAAYAYPAVRQFGDKTELFGGEPYSPLRLKRGNVIDAMALVRKSAWAAAGGYDHVRYGWEDYDFWCRLAELGEFGLGVPEVLADYRVHARSMLHTMTEVRGHKLELIADLERRHPWLDIPTELD